MKNSLRTTHSVIGLGVAAVCLLAAPLWATAGDDQGTGAQGPPQQSGTEAVNSSLQEVVVTATRHEESLSKVPISVSALTQDTMDSMGIKDFQDIARFLPGVSIDTAGTNAISIRGISSSAGAGATGIYLDDTPIQMRDVGFNPDDTLPKTFDLQRVEVLRGPQGTLFGSGSEGGTVRYILTQPNVSSSSTYVRAEAAYGQYGEPNYEFGIAHGAPIVDGTLGYRASIWYRYDGGWISHVDPNTGAVTENKTNYSNSVMARVAGIWQPATPLAFTLSFIYQDQKKNDVSTYWPAYSDPSAGHFATGTPERIPVDDRWYLPALKIQYDFAKSAIVSVTSYYNRYENTGYQGTVYDLAYFQLLGWPSNPLFGNPAGLPGLGCQAVTPPPPANCPWYPLIDANGIHTAATGYPNFYTPNVMTNSQVNYVEELRWQSTDDSSRWKWTVGLFWQLAKEGSIEQLQDPLNQIDPFFNAIYQTTATAIFGPYYSCPNNAAYPYIPACDIYYLNNKTQDKQIAAYGEVSYAFSDQWRLTVGERYAHTSFNISSYADGLENFGPIYPGQPLVPRTGETTANPSTPKATLSFQMDPKNLFYASYAKGFRVGGGNAPLPAYCNFDLGNAGYPNGAPLIYNPDSTQNYEIGSKNAIGSNFKIATSVYYINWNSIQQNVYIGGSCGLQFIDNLGTAVSKGFDLQAQLAAGPMLFDLAAGYTNARYTKDSPIVNTAGLPLVRSGDAISGQASINYAPGLGAPWTVALGAEYRFRPWQRDAFLRVDWEYESSNPWLSPLQDPGTSQYYPSTYALPATNFVSLRAGMTFGDWIVTAFCDNLLNSQTVTNYALGLADYYAPSGGVATPSVQQNQFTFHPRTLGITATWRLGPGG